MIFGTSDREAIFEEVRLFCALHLGSGVSDFLFFEIGRHSTVFGLDLRDGRRALLKAHTSQIPRERQEVVHRVQLRLHEAGFPCPRPLLRPLPVRGGHARIEELIEAGEPRDAHDPRVRRQMAKGLARQIRLLRDEPPGPLAEPTVFDRPGIWGDRQENGEASAAWIDVLAAPAKRMAGGAGPRVVAHGDWTAKNMRFGWRRVKVVYDWDSLKFETEERIVGRVSAKFTVLEGVPNIPTPQESRAFVDEYEKERGERFSPQQRRRIAGARAYAVALKAHVEHRKKRGRVGPWQRALRQFGPEYVEP